MTAALPWTLSEWGEHTRHSRHWHRVTSALRIEATEAIHLVELPVGEHEIRETLILMEVRIYAAPPHDWHVGMRPVDRAIYTEEHGHEVHIARRIRGSWTPELAALRGRLDVILNTITTSLAEPT